jgi:lysophospholipase L1-like esterase
VLGFKPWLLGTTPVALPRFRAALAGVRAGTGNARVFCFGDSTTAGFSASPFPGADMFAQSYPAQIAPLLATALRTTVNANAVIGTHNLPASAFGDGRVTTTGFTHLNGGAGAFFRALSAASLVFAPGVSWDTADIYYVRTVNTGWSYQVGAGSVQTPTVSGTAGPAKFTVTKAPGSETLTLAWVANDVRIGGVHFYTAATKEVTVFNAGVSGAQASGVISTGIIGGLDWLAFWDPDLSIIDWGINEFFTSASVAAFDANLQQIVDTLRAAGSDVVMKTPVHSNSAFSPPQSDYIAASRAVAARNRLPLIDIAADWVDYATSNALSRYSDGVHPNGSGYLDIAQRVALAIPALLPSPYSLAAQAIFAAMGTVPDAARRALYDQLVLGIQSDGNWDLVDVLYLHAAHDAASGRINLRNPGRFAAATAGATASHTTDRGYAFSSTGHLTTSFNPFRDGVAWGLDGAHIYGYVNQTSSDVGSNGAIVGTSTTSSTGTWLIHREASDRMLARINGVTTSVTANSSVATRLGGSLVTRTGAAALTFYKNGVSIGTDNDASSAVQDEEVWIGRYLNNYNTLDRIAAVSMGGGLDATKQAALHSRIVTFLTAIGAN